MLRIRSIMLNMSNLFLETPKKCIIKDDIHNIVCHQQVMSLKKQKYWYKLDNAGKIFPAVSQDERSNVFRLSFYLDETIDSTLLEEAVNKVKRSPSNLKTVFFGITLLLIQDILKLNLNLLKCANTSRSTEIMVIYLKFIILIIKSHLKHSMPSLMVLERCTF